MIKRCSLILIILSVSALVSANIETETLTRDPFAKPTSATLERKVPATRIVKPQPKPKPWQPNLIATIVSGEKSLANIDGKILKLGQRINGYRLIAVARYSATFQRKGKKHTFRLYRKDH